jgi:hypothetical protein
MSRDQVMRNTHTFTDEELLKLPKDGYKRELVDGKIVMSPAGYRHGRVIMQDVLPGFSCRLAAIL